MKQPPSRHVALLKRALLANILFSSLSAVVFLVAAGPVGDLVGCDPGRVAGTGVNLIIFVGLMIPVVTRRDPLPGWSVWLAVVIAAMDVLWVVATPFSIAPFTPAGKGLFISIGLVVAVLAVMQIRALAGIFDERRRAPGDLTPAN